MIEKCCCRCKITKPSNCFHKNRSARDGLQHCCKECADEYLGIKRKIKPCLGGQRYCYKCNQYKPFSEFYGKDKEKPKGGSESRCKACIKEVQRIYRKENGDKIKEWDSTHRKNNPESRRHYQLRAKYGISLEEYRKLLAEQNNVCAICEGENPVNVKKFMAMAVDHCHNTGKLRAILCSFCNSGLGYFRDNPTILRQAALYIERHQNSNPVA